MVGGNVSALVICYMDSSIFDMAAVNSISLENVHVLKTIFVQYRNIISYRTMLVGRIAQVT